MRYLVLVAMFLAVRSDPIPAQSRMRARDLGVAPGVFQPGVSNAITDVAGVRVGQVTLVVGDSVRTGVTAILPHGGNPFLERVPAGFHVGNGFGKFLGVTQIRELGEIETPILLTCTLCVWRAADAMIEWMLERPGMQEVRSINAVVGETNDGGLNAIRSRPITAAAVRSAIEGATTGPVAEGSVGAGTGTQMFSWKGGIGTSSRVLPGRLGGWSVGVLVQSNYGGILQVLGAPVGKELGSYAFKSLVEPQPGDGSIIMVVATDAPLSERNLERLAARAIMGLARTGSFASNGSGDYAIAFSTAESVRRRMPRQMGQAPPSIVDLPNDDMSGLFAAAVEATEEAVYNSLFMATTVESRFGKSEAIPLRQGRGGAAEVRDYEVGAGPCPALGSP